MLNYRALEAEGLQGQGEIHQSRVGLIILIEVII